MSRSQVPPAIQQMPSRNSSGNNLAIILIVIFGSLGLMLLVGCAGIFYVFMTARNNVLTAMDRIGAESNLQQTGFALHNYHDTYNKFPAPAAVNAEGRPVWSWRVSILPFLPATQDFNPAMKYEAHLENNRYEMQPWDAPQNAQLQGPAPPIFQSFMSKPLQNHAQVFLITAPADGEGAPVFIDGKYTRLSEITDGTSNTLLAIHFNDYSKPWQSPIR